MVKSLPMRSDPTANLHWSEYRGAIQDRFETNALKHPERLCVVETASSASSRREFTSAQINRASNVLAHHLVQKGIERSDAFTVYAHRGVDLPVAAMGILKARAMFLVIDPAYPPDRQVMFLDVARPRALIIIAKAAQETGKLSETVRSYIDDDLDIKTEIPGLLLNEYGILLGGQFNGSDVFSEQLEKADYSPGIVVGPDSTPALSFTSGSGGRPKGVKG